MYQAGGKNMIVGTGRIDPHHVTPSEVLRYLWIIAWTQQFHVDYQLDNRRIIITEAGDDHPTQ